MKQIERTQGMQPYRAITKLSSNHHPYTCYYFGSAYDPVNYSNYNIIKFMRNTRSVIKFCLNDNNEDND